MALSRSSNGLAEVRTAWSRTPHPWLMLALAILLSPLLHIAVIVFVGLGGNDSAAETAQ